MINTTHFIVASEERERVKRGSCPCECQITLDCWGRGLSSLHRSTPHFLLSSFCLSLFPFFLCASLILFFHFLIFFQPPLAHCSPLFLSLFFPFSLSFSVISLQCTCSPSYLSSSVCFFFYPCTCSPFWLLHLSSFFLQLTRSPSWLALSLFSVCLYFFIYAQSPF